MNKKPRRKRIGKGIYRDAYGLSVTVKVGSGSAALQREKRYPFDTPFKDLREWQDGMRATLRRLAGRPATNATRGTLAADATRFLNMMKGRVSYKSLRSEMEAWTALYGRLRRSHLTDEQIKVARGGWLEAGYSEKTVNNRCQALRQLYHALDGDDEPTPVDKLKPLKVRPSVKHNVHRDIFRTVATNLAADPKTRARFMVIACTGCRPSELKRATRGDVDLERRIWTVDTGKGGDPRVFYLNDDMLIAWTAFVKADAWGLFDASDYAKALYAAGWPKDIRPYQARHSVALELQDLGIDLGDISGFLGHANVATTRKFYAPLATARLKGASDVLAGRFGGWEPDPSTHTEESRQLLQMPEVSGVH